MKKFFLFLAPLLSGIAFSAWSQTDANLGAGPAPEVFKGFDVKIPGSMYYPATGINGSPYFFDEVLPGTIYFTNGMVSEPVRLKYDGLTDQLVILSEIASQYVKVDKNLISSFEFTRRSGGETQNYVFKKLNFNAGAPETGFFAQVLSEGPVSAYVKRNVVYTGKKEEEVVQNQLVLVKKIKKKPLYYLVLPEQTVVALKKISRRRLIKALPAQDAGPIKNLLVKNRIKVRREKGFSEAAILIDNYFKHKE